jgi:TIR domain
VADVLRHAGHTVQYQDEDIPIGANFIERMSQLVEDCQHLIVILSPAYLGSTYCREEWTNFLADLFASQGERRVVVLLAQDCKPPGILRARVFGSLFDKLDPTERRMAILAAAQGQAARIKIDPPIFQMMTARNPAFCGRDDVLARLDEALFRSIGKLASDVPPIAIIGSGGVGKSSIAAEYAYRHSGDYWGVWWLPAQSRPTLIASLNELAKRIDPKLSLDASKATIESADLEIFAKAALSRTKAAPLPWLLIYDNVDNPASVADLLPPKGVHVLITTRWSDWHGIATELALDVFTPEISQNFLLERANSRDKSGAARLAAALEFLPLALDQAGALCKRTGLSFGDYATRVAELIRIRPAGSGYPQSVFGTFSIAMDAAVASCPDAEKLMSFLAFLAPDSVPLDFVSGTVMDVMERTRALEALTAVSLVSIREGHVRLHRLVQEVMRQRVHEARTFAELRPVILGMLRRAIEDTSARAAQEGADERREVAYENVLWALHYDPSEETSLDEVEWTHNEHIDIEVSFRKRPDGILRITRAMDGGRPFHRVETLYFLDGGWKSRELSNRMF